MPQTPERERLRGRQRARGGMEAKMGAHRWQGPEAPRGAEGDRKEQRQGGTSRVSTEVEKQGSGAKLGAHLDPTPGTDAHLAGTSYEGPVGLSQGEDVQPGPCRGDRGPGAGKGMEKGREEGR